jgi:DNA helicase IV
MEKYKQELIEQVKSHIGFIKQKIQQRLNDVTALANTSLSQISKMAPADQVVYMDLRANAQKRVVELDHLDGSPYFIKCKIVTEQGQEEEYFFAKHEFSEQSIYSWVAPVAAIRFESPGQTSYKLPSGKTKTITIKQKEQYMIVDGTLLFFSLESENKPRELIYQEYFTKQKSEFALPEIVAQMEKAQDQVIRAHHRGPMIISGPAGSGKTTLALHRVAYLTQAPDTAELYPSRSIVIFVQDTGTKDYFSTLLPGLGIRDVTITTFSEWAFLVLNMMGYTYVDRYGDSDEEKDLYEYQKLKALRENTSSVWSRNYFIALSSHYEDYFSAQNNKLFARQKKEKKLDRFDLTILLKLYFEKYKKFETKREYQVWVKDKLINRIENTLISYSLVIVDEFQNYLPEQLRIFKNCLQEKTQSSVYVGDIAQQVKLGTIKNWKDIDEDVSLERNIRLSKVYRNTKNILDYIQTLGYSIEIPDGLKQGPVVTEKIIDTIPEEIAYIKEYLPTYEKGSIGILAKNDAYLDDFRKEFSNVKNIHVLTMVESQGVEFDIVFIVGIHKESFEVVYHEGALAEYIEERKRIQKDILYVALTRAITELHILGREKLKHFVN